MLFTQEIGQSNAYLSFSVLLRVKVVKILTDAIFRAVIFFREFVAIA